MLTFISDTRFAESLLSFGQRQLFCLARAVLKGAICLVLDESTSNLDSETEKQFLKSSNDAFRGKTVITIAVRIKLLSHLYPHHHGIAKNYFSFYLLLFLFNSPSLVILCIASSVLTSRIRPCCNNAGWKDNRRRQSQRIKSQPQECFLHHAQCIRHQQTEIIEDER